MVIILWGVSINIINGATPGSSPFFNAMFHEINQPTSELAASLVMDGPMEGFSKGKKFVNGCQGYYKTWLWNKVINMVPLWSITMIAVI